MYTVKKGFEAVLVVNGNYPAGFVLGDADEAQLAGLIDAMPEAIERESPAAEVENVAVKLKNK